MSILKKIIKINAEESSYEDIFEKELSINRERVVGDDTEIVDSLKNEKASQKFLYEISGENKTRNTVLLFSLLKISIIALILTVIATAFYVNSLKDESPETISKGASTSSAEINETPVKEVKEDLNSVTGETEPIESEDAGKVSENEISGPTDSFVQIMDNYNSEFAGIYKGFNSLSDEYISGAISQKQFKESLSGVLSAIDQSLKTLEGFESRASQNVYDLGIYNSVYSRHSNIYNNILRMNNTIFDIEIKEIIKKARRTDIKYTTYLHNFF